MKTTRALRKGHVPATQSDDKRMKRGEGDAVDGLKAVCRCVREGRINRFFTKEHYKREWTERKWLTKKSWV